MQTAREFFVHELNDVFDAEQRLLQALEEQAGLAANAQLSKSFESHRKQTERQVERLQLVFEELGESPESTECHGMIGLIEEVHAFQEEEPSEELMDLFLAGAAAKVEKYEISSYEGLVRLAKQMKLKKAEQLLQQNLKEEQQTLKKMEGFEKKMKPTELGMEEEGESGGRSRRKRAA